VKIHLTAIFEFLPGILMVLNFQDEMVETYIAVACGNRTALAACTL